MFRCGYGSKNERLLLCLIATAECMQLFLGSVVYIYMEIGLSILYSCIYFQKDVSNVYSYCYSY
jgi:hypothetical protein